MSFSTFVERLFRRSTSLNRYEIVGWWELRRLPYNLVVGATGIVTVVIMVVTSIICEKRIGVAIGMPDPPIFAIFGIVAYGMAANACFTAGWVVELVLGEVWGVRSPRFAEIAFGLGLLGSVLLTLLPAAVTVVMAVATLAGWIPVQREAGG